MRHQIWSTDTIANTEWMLNMMSLLINADTFDRDFAQQFASVDELDKYLTAEILCSYREEAQNFLAVADIFIVENIYNRQMVDAKIIELFKDAWHIAKVEGMNHEN